LIAIQQNSGFTEVTVTTSHVKLNKADAFEWSSIHLQSCAHLKGLVRIIPLAT